MANQRTDTQSVINLVINGKQGMTSLRELTDAQRKLNAEVRNMKPTDQGYAERLKELQAINAALEEQRRVIRGIDDDSDDLKTTWKDIAAGILSADMFEKVADWAGEAISKIRDAFQETEKFRAVLTVAFSGNADLAESSLKMLAEFAAKTPFALNEATEGFIKLVNRGFIPTQKELIKMGDLASSQGKSLDQYIEAQLDAQTGEFERLKEFGIIAHKNGDVVSLSFRGITKEVENSDKAIRDALLQFGEMDGIKGSMEAVSATLVGIRSNIDDTWDQIFTGIGKGSSNMITGFYKSYGALLSWFKESFIDVKLSEAMEKDRFELVKLEMQLNSSNTKQEDRLKILNKLKEQYPDYFKNIDADKIGTAQLTKAFKDLNAQYLNRIVLQKQNESLEKSENERAETKLSQFKAEGAIRDYLARIKDKAPNLQLYGKNEIDQAKSLLSQLQANGDKAIAGVSRFAKNDLKNLLADYQFIDDKFLSQTNATTKIANERQKLAKSLGLNPDESLDPKVVAAPVIPTLAPKVTEDKKAESARKKALAEFNKLDKEYAKLGLDRLDDQLTKNAKEVEQEGRKYDDLIKKEQAFIKMKGATAAQIKAAEEKIELIKADKKTALDNLAVRQEDELQKKITNLRQSFTKIQATEYNKQQININTFYDGLEKDNAGNEEKLADLKIARVLDLSDAEIREKERLEKEKAQIEEEYKTLTGNKDDTSLAKLNKKYDDEIAALREKFSTELQATQEFKDAVDRINGKRDAEIAKTEAQSKKENKDLALQAAQQVSDATFQIINANRKRETDLKLSALDKERNDELSKKNLSEKQKEAINKKYDEKAKAIKLKAWKADKAAAVAQAVISGALAVIKALPNIPLAIASGIAATAQIAVILAQKPPEFGVGVRNFKGGKALVGEKGPEAVNENGKWWLAQSATLADLEPGTDVYTASDTASMMKGKPLSEKLYSPTSYSVDSTAIRSAERNYRSAGNGGFVSTSTAPATSPGAAPAGSDLDDMKNMLSQMMELQKAEMAKPVKLSYQAWEEFDANVKQVRISQTG